MAPAGKIKSSEVFTQGRRIKILINTVALAR